MIESEMEDLLWEHPEKFLHEPLKQFERQSRSPVGRHDISFIDSIGRILVIEVKHGTLPRGIISQLVDYLGMYKARFPDKVVEMMAIANSIPKERRLACEQYDIEAKEIPEKKFRDVAKEVGYPLKSEDDIPLGTTAPGDPPTGGGGLTKNEARLEFWRAFREYIRDRAPRIKPFRPAEVPSIDLPLGTTGHTIKAWLYMDKGIIGARFKGDVAGTMIGQLKQHQQDIDKRFGASVFGFGKQSKGKPPQEHIEIRRTADFANRDSWPELHQWLANTIMKFDEVLTPFVMKIVETRGERVHPSPE